MAKLPIRASLLNEAVSFVKSSDVMVCQTRGRVLERMGVVLRSTRYFERFIRVMQFQVCTIAKFGMRGLGAPKARLREYAHRKFW